MDEIAVGAKEILACMHVGTWRTIQYWKKNCGFDKLIRHTPHGKPFIIKDEAYQWLIEYDEIKKGHYAKK